MLCRPIESTVEDDSDDDSDDEEEEEAEEFAFPELDSQIREVVKEYGAVFPKLNFSSPRVCISIPPLHSLPTVAAYF